MSKTKVSPAAQVTNWSYQHDSAGMATSVRPPTFVPSILLVRARASSLVRWRIMRRPRSERSIVRSLLVGSVQRLRFTSSSGRFHGASKDDVPEIVARSEDEAARSLLDYFREERPLVLRGLAADFPAVQRWKSLDYLDGAVPSDVPCDVEMGAYNGGERLTISFGEYMQYLRMWQQAYDGDAGGGDAPILYLAQNDLTAFGRLPEDVRIPAFCGDGRVGVGRVYSCMLWLGPRGCVSPLHFDPLDNLLVQITGRKRVLLLSKETSASCLYCGQSHDQQNNTSAVDIESPDLSRFPKLESALADLRSTTLEPGDALYIPSRWWHHVRSLDLSISMNVWWR